MLVLSRRVNEAFRIGDNITIKVLEIRGHTVRFGIEAPDSVTIVREELLEELESCNNSDQAHMLADGNS